MGKDLSEDWFISYFSDDYWDLVQSYGLLPIELAFLDEILQDRRNVLDLCCGKGRILFPLAERGFKVTGLDLNSKSIEYVNQYIIERNLTATVQCKDIRTLNYELEFDAVLLLQSSFGYFSDEENNRLLKQISDSLVPNGILILDIANRDGMIKQFRDKEWASIQNKFYLIHHQFDFMSSTRTTSLTVVEGDQTRKYKHVIRLYTISELVHLLEDAGLHVVNICGDFKMEHPSFQTRRIQVIAKK